MKNPLLFGVCALSLLAGISAKASPLYDFAFSIPIDGGGAITGEIVGLQDNATSVPDDIVITSDPYNPAVALSSGDYSLKDNGYLQSPYVDGRFVVTTLDGTVGISGTGLGDGSGNTGLSWYKVLTASPYAQIAYDFNYYSLTSGDNGEGTEGTDIATNFYGNGDGFAGATYFPGTLSAVPEPSHWGAGILLAFAAAGLGRRLFPRSGSCLA